MLAVLILLFSAPAVAQDVTLSIEPPPGELVLSIAQNGEIQTHCPPACEIEMPAGGLEVTLHRRRTPDVLAAAELHLRDDSLLLAYRTDREAERIGGWLLVGLVAIPGAALALTGLLWALAAGSAGDVPAEAWALLGVGDVLFVVGLSVGLYLAFHFDEHRIELVPGDPAPGTARD